MKKYIFFLFFTGLFSTAYAQPDSWDTSTANISVSGMYSGLFGFPVDTINNLTLYRTVAEWLNTPYRYSGRTKKGIDCSDFTRILYDTAFHISINGSSDDIFTKVTPLEKHELREGDMVFFKIKKKRISHVGVYLTNNKFAHATVQAGVIVSDMDEPYYKKYFFKGGRLEKNF